MSALELLRDEHELEWYFSKGEIAFEHSTFGSMLERAELFSVAQLYHAERRPVYDEDGHVIGHECGITARPTAEIREPSGYVPDSDTLQRYAHVSTLLKAVAKQSRRCVQVLELLYGDCGQRWAPSVPYGRLGALFHLTAKGIQLIEAARATKGSLDMRDMHRIEVIVQVQCVQPKPDRAQALAYCFAQAKALEHRARATWLAVKSPDTTGRAA